MIKVKGFKEKKKILLIFILQIKHLKAYGEGSIFEGLLFKIILLIINYFKIIIFYFLIK